MGAAKDVESMHRHTSRRKMLLDVIPLLLFTMIPSVVIFV